MESVMCCWRNLLVACAKCNDTFPCCSLWERFSKLPTCGHMAHNLRKKLLILVQNKGKLVIWVANKSKLVTIWVESSNTSGKMEKANIT